MKSRVESTDVSLPTSSSKGASESILNARLGSALRAGELKEELDAVFDFFAPDCKNRMGGLIRRGTDEIIATPRTSRWNLDQCNNQEKAYLGVNIENLLRGTYNLPDGTLGMDFSVRGVDVDVKWSRTFGRWQIPTEAVGHICLLVHADDLTGEMAVGLIRIRDELLVGGNKDKKRTIQSPGGMSEIRWLVDRGTPVPENFLMSLRKRDRDAILAPLGGDERARELFTRCEGLIISRQTIESIGQQSDGARRFRGETRAALLEDGFEVLNGHWIKDRERALVLGGVVLNSSAEWVCLRTDGSTPHLRQALEPARMAESAAFRLALKKAIKLEGKARRAALDLAKAEAAELAEEFSGSDYGTFYTAPAVQRAEAEAAQAVDCL